MPATAAGLLAAIGANREANAAAATALTTVTLSALAATGSGKAAASAALATLSLSALAATGSGGVTDPTPPTVDMVKGPSDWAGLQTSAIDNQVVGLTAGTYDGFHLTRPGVTYICVDAPYSVVIKLAMVDPAGSPQGSQYRNEFYYGVNADDITIINCRITSDFNDRNTTDETGHDLFESNLLIDGDGFTVDRPRLYNCIVDNTFNVGSFHATSDLIFQDCLFYNIGFDAPTSAHGHCGYFPNLPSVGTAKQLINCMYGQSFKFAFQMYDADNANNVAKLYVDRIISTNQNTPGHIIGCESPATVNDIKCTNSAFLKLGIRFGYNSPTKSNGVLTGNYWAVAPADVSSGWTSLTNSGNTMIDTGEWTGVNPCLSGAYLAVAHLWWRSNSSASSMTFDVSGCGMVNGATYRLRNGENPFNDATTGANNIIDFTYGVTSGYGGGTITVPTTSRTRATPVGGVGTTHSVPDLTTDLAKMGIWLMERTVS